MELEAFIVRAKASTYVGSGAAQAASRPPSHDLGYAQDGWRYLDSYYGGTDFLGQEVVWRDAEPVWAMNYYGRILRPDLIDAGAAGATIRKALSAMYAEGRFLGGFQYRTGPFLYVDASTGRFDTFTGVERIFSDGAEAYRLDYHGGLIRP